MDSVRVACIPDLAALILRVRDANSTGEVLPCVSADDAIPAIARGDVHCTVVAVDASSFDRDIGNIRRLREAFPSHPVVAWCQMQQLSSRQLLDIAEFSVTELVFRGLTDSKSAFAQVLRQARDRAKARDISGRLSHIMPPDMLPIFMAALEHAAEAMDVERLAASFGITRRTLFNRLVHSGLPKPRSFIIWCRLLVAGSLLDERGRTLDSVALLLNFSTPANLGASLRRYVGATITQLRRGEVSPVVEAEFARIVHRGRVRAAAARQNAHFDSLPMSSSAD